MVKTLLSFFLPRFPSLPTECLANQRKVCLPPHPLHLLPSFCMSCHKWRIWFTCWLSTPSPVPLPPSFSSTFPHSLLALLNLPHIYFCFHFSLRCSFDVPPTFCSQAACVLAGARAHWSHSKWRKNQGRASWQLAPRLPLCSIVLSSTRGTLNRWSNFIFTATLFWTMPSVRFPISCSSHPIGGWMTLWHARSRMKGGRVQLRPRSDQVLGLFQSQGMKTTWGCFWKSVCTAHIYVHATAWFWQWQAWGDDLARRYLWNLKVTRFEGWR